MNASNPTVHEDIARFKIAVDKASSSLRSQTAEIIQSEFTLFPASSSLSDYNASFLSEHKNSPRHIFASLRVKHLISSDNRDDVDAVAALDLPHISLTEAIEGYELLLSHNSSQAGEYKSKAASRWPEATRFESSS